MFLITTRHCEPLVFSVAQWSVVIRAVSLDVDSTDALAKLRASRSLLFFAVGAAVGVAAARGLQQGVVWQRHGLVEQGVQSLLVDPSFGELHLKEEEETAQLARSSVFGTVWSANVEAG